MLAGCGGGSSSSRGRAIFHKDCSGCHTLTGHDTHADGGDLALLRIDVADIASFARVMPVRPPLTRAESFDVARYVHARAASR